jgi:hypothetical protein
MAKTLRIALLTVAALAAGSSAVLAQTRGRMMDNDTQAVEQLPPSASARAVRAQRSDPYRYQQDLQVEPDNWNPDGTSPRVDSQ